jgi:hypothetical protein
MPTNLRAAIAEVQADGLASSVPIGRKPGRPRDPDYEAARSLLPHRSARTQARLVSAIRTFIAIGLAPEQVGKAIQEATRSSGALNVRLLERYAQFLDREVRNG